MPYTNNWRVPALRLQSDCFRCTVPATSGQKGIEMANILEQEGRNVIGWDDEWGIEWSTNSLKYGGAAAFQRLNNRHTKAPQKVVLLMHDQAYRSPEAGQELEKFIGLAKASGYVFRTVDSFESDSL